MTLTKYYNLTYRDSHSFSLRCLRKLFISFVALYINFNASKNKNLFNYGDMCVHFQTNIESKKNIFKSWPVGPICHFKHIILVILRGKMKITQRQKVVKDMINNIHMNM